VRYWLNPFRIRDGVRNLRKIHAGGGPKLVRLAGIGQPDGWFLPASEIRLEVEAVDGSKVELRPVVPVPFPYAWAYRVARRFGVPIVSTIDPEKVRLAVPVPGR
jgi:hypothetical protein